MKPLHQMSPDELAAYFKSAFDTSGKIEADIAADQHVQLAADDFQAMHGSRPIVIIDGNAWGVILGEEIDLQKYPSGWGSTIEEAFADLVKTMGKQATKGESAFLG